MGQVLIAGGLSGSGANPTSFAELFNPGEMSFTPTGKMHSARAFSSAIIVPEPAQDWSGRPGSNRRRPAWEAHLTDTRDNRREAKRIKKKLSSKCVAS